MSRTGPLRALVVEHDAFSAPGLVGESLADFGYEVVRDLVVPADRADSPDVEHTFADPTEFDLVVALGAPWSAYDDTAIGSWLRPELDMLRRAHQGEIPVLGVCFGAQALSLALGGSVAPAPDWEIGYHPVETDEPRLVSAGPWFQFHHDQMTPPSEAVVVARNAMGVQAWRLGRSLAVQFHPEVTPDVVELWLTHGGHQVLQDLGQDVEQLRTSLRENAARAAYLTHSLVKSFMIHVDAPVGFPVDSPVTTPASGDDGQ
jgi:GMP synthase-like glutamine amidotransferase